MKPFPLRRQRGLGLVEALIALAILSFGLLGLSRLQARMLTQGTEAQARLQASQIADELLDMALVDPGNAACYTVPAAGNCGVPAAATAAAGWAASAVAALPGGATGATAGATLGNNQLAVRLTWRGKPSTQDANPPTRVLEVRTDVR